YYRSYEEHFAAHPEDLEELVRTAGRLRNPHAEATTGVDLQVPAIMTYLERHGLALRGGDVVDIGSWGGRGCHPLSAAARPADHPRHRRSRADAGAVLAAKEVPGRLGRSGARRGGRLRSWRDTHARHSAGSWSQGGDLASDCPRDGTTVRSSRSSTSPAGTPP